MSSISPTRKLKRAATVTASRALVTDGSGNATTGATTATELGYVNGVTSAIQTQFSNKQPLNANLTAAAALTIAADSLAIGTGAAAFTQTSFAANTFPAKGSTGSLVAKTITDLGLSLLNDSTAAAMRSRIGAASSASPLTYWTESQATTSPNSTIHFNSFAVVESGSHAAIALVPKGNGGFALAIPDSSTTGGNVRGTQSVDLQLSRSAATQVSSGTNSFAAGRSSTASGDACIAIGGAAVASGDGSVALNIGNSSGTQSFAFSGGNASGTAAAAGGNGTSASGDYSFAMGNYSKAVLLGQRAFQSGDAPGVVFAAGASQVSDFNLQAVTTDATQTECLLSWSVAGSRLTIPNNTTWAFEMLISARRTDATGGNDAWKVLGLIHRDANAASTTLDALSINQIGSSAWTIAVDADTTNGALRLKVTGEAAKTVHWTAHAHAVETA